MVIKRTLMTSILFIFALSCGSEKGDKVKIFVESKPLTICESLQLIHHYIIGKEVDVIGMEEAASQLENLTKIKSAFAGNPLGLKRPSVENYNNWSNWLKTNGIVCKENEHHKLE